MANRTAIHGEHWNLQAIASPCQRIGIDVAHLNAFGAGRELKRQLGDELVA